MKTLLFSVGRRRRSIQILALAALATPLIAMQVSSLGRAVHSDIVCAGAESGSGAPLILKKDDHIAILGNVLADRMQFDGWLETLIQAQHPQDNLVFRNLSAPGDEVSTWHRSAEFGSRDEWLTKTGASVIFAFYGYNESFKGAAGIAEFKSNLDQFLKETARKNYSGKGAPRIVLFSPIADEKNQDPNYPDPAKTNANLALYTAAMAEVAKANDVRFVDLFTHSEKIYAAQIKHSLTVNGHYLTEEGYKALAPIMFDSIFGTAAPSGDFEKLRAAINEKNWQWRERYRTIDGYNVYGGRSHNAYVSGKGGPKITNNKVMQEEMSQRDVMTANREHRVWAIADGKDLQVDDSNLPKVTEVKTNFPGPNPDGSWKFLGGEEAIKHMTMAAHCKVNLFASEEQFPELIKPLQMTWDSKGRLWVSVWRNYPERTPTSKVGDSILIFEDTKGTGHADKCTHFIDDLNAPTGFQLYKNGILLMQAPDVWYAEDTTGGDHANKVERVLMGMDSADSHHTTNSMVYDPGGAVYLSDGVFHRTQVETTDGATRNDDACIYRFFPKTGEFERYAPYGFANPHGRVFDYWGNDIITDATGNASYFGPAFSGHLDEGKHEGMKQFWARPSRPCPGTGLITTKAFPEEFWGNFLNCNVIGFQGIYRVKMNEEGSGIEGKSLENFVSSDDPQFRPSQVCAGPDGAVYFADWSNAIIGHLQHHLRDPNRDHEHGRIYRMIYEGLPLDPVKKIAGQPIPALLALLKDPENQTRTLAKIELDKLPTADVIAAVDAWVPTLDSADPAYPHHLMEALWVHQWQNVVDEELLKKMLRSPEPHARAAATRVLCYWRTHIPDAIDLLKIQADDESPRVRLEAIRAASFFPDGRAADIALTSLKHPSDYYLEYTLKETMKQLEKYWKPYMASGGTLAENNSAGTKYIFQNMKTKELEQMKHSEPVLEAMLIRSDIPDAERTTTLVELATLKKTTPVNVVLTSLDGAAGDVPMANALAKLLPMQSADDLKPVRDRLLGFATKGISPEVRALGWASVASADESVDKAYEQASKSPAALTDYFDGLSGIYDQDIRAKAYPQVRPFLDEQLPANLTGAAVANSGVMGQIVRIELPKKGQLSLAEVQVFSNGKNVALHAHATQSSTGPGGDASKAVDGKTDGSFAAGGVSETAEKSKGAIWWQVDLGHEYPIESIVVWNRTDGGAKISKHLDGYNLIVLDATGKVERFKSEDNAAPSESATFKLASDPVKELRNAAIRAAVSMTKPKIQQETFAALVQLIVKDVHVVNAAQGIRTLPRTAWDKAQVGQLADALVSWAKKVPADDRSNPDCVETVQFAGDLAGMLPTPQATAMRKVLKELRVAVFVVRTVHEQMRYDTPRLVVEAGKPFEIIFTNADSMGHNLAVVNPSTRAKIAAMAATMQPTALDSEGRAFMPKSKDILAATKLVEPGERQTLKIIAPDRAGDYEYFCTYPGHFEMMWGRLIVTKDVDAYLQEHPDASLPGAAAAMPPGHEHYH